MVAKKNGVRALLCLSCNWGVIMEKGNLGFTKRCPGIKCPRCGTDDIEHTTSIEDGGFQCWACNAEWKSIPCPSCGSLMEGKGSTGCYIATCVYGSYDCPEVWTLRRFRDDIMQKSLLGKMFIRTYYATSPSIVAWFGRTRWFDKLFKFVLDPFVRALQNYGIARTPYDDK